MLDLEHYTIRDKKPYERLEKSSVAHAFDYIVFGGNPGLTSCENFAMNLSKARLLTSVECYRKRGQKETAKTMKIKEKDKNEIQRRS